MSVDTLELLMDRLEKESYFQVSKTTFVLSKIFNSWINEASWTKMLCTDMSKLLSSITTLVFYMESDKSNALISG